MKPEDCSRIGKAYDMLSDWVGIGYVWWPDDEDSDHWNESACILQQLIAEYELWD